VVSQLQEMVVVTFFSVPSNLLVLSAIVSLVLLVLHRRAGAILAVLSLAALAISGFSPLGNAADAARTAVSGASLSPLKVS
jgi:hypothetical protein